MARDWNAEWQQIANQENQAWNAHMEALATVTEAFAGNGTPTEDVLDMVDEAEQLIEDAKTKRKEFINDYRASQP